MIREKYESLAVHDLKEIAKARGIKGLSTMKKAEVIDAMLRLDAQENAEIKTERSVPCCCACGRRGTESCERACTSL